MSRGSLKFFCNWYQWSLHLVSAAAGSIYLDLVGQRAWRESPADRSSASVSGKLQQRSLGVGSSGDHAITMVNGYEQGVEEGAGKY